MTERSPFRPGPVIGLVAAGLVSFAAFILLLAWGEPSPDRQATARGAAPSVSATGFKGIMDLASRFVAVGPATRPGDFDRYDLLVVPLNPQDEPQEVARLLRRRSGRPTLLILPKWAVMPDSAQRRWVRAIGPFHKAAADRLVGPAYSVEPMSARADARVDTFRLLAGLKMPMPAMPQVIHGDAVQMLAGVPAEGALVAQLGVQPHYVVADPDLLSNHGLRRPEAARAALGMLERMMPSSASTILFAPSVAGPEAPQERNLLRSLFEPPFIVMTLALLVAALLAGLHGAGRFGPVRRPVRALPFGKAALVENSAGLVRLTGREAQLGAGYADAVRDEAARAGAAPAHLKGEALEAYLDRFTKPGGTPFSVLARAVRSAGGKTELLSASRALFGWKKDMIR